jgi:hypothetical protein
MPVAGQFFCAVLQNPTDLSDRSESRSQGCAEIVALQFPPRPMSIDAAIGFRSSMYASIT